MKVGIADGDATGKISGKCEARSFRHLGAFASDFSRHGGAWGGAAFQWDPSKLGISS